MRLACIRGRSHLVVDDLAIDVEEMSGGKFSSRPSELLADWPAFRRWVGANGPSGGGREFDLADLDAPVPQPGQVFAIGVNYSAHAVETGHGSEAMPVVFTKFSSSITGPVGSVALPGDSVDWEVELVVVIGRSGRSVSRDDAWRYVAGLMVGQDLSDREMQMVGLKPQFSLAKSHAGFGPTGPWMVTPDEFPNPDDLRLWCEVSGEVLQDSRTSRMTYSVPVLIERLSEVCELRPGDLIFTGTPEGVGNARTPKRFLRRGDVLVSGVEGVGSLRQTFI